MLLTLTTTHKPATDLGFLVHKHPDRVFSFTLLMGHAQVFYPEASEERCTAALLVELDPVELSRGKAGGGSGAPLEPYINDRPYAASSFLTGALHSAFGTAMSGRSKERQDRADQELPFEVRLPARGTWSSWQNWPKPRRGCSSPRRTGWWSCPIRPQRGSGDGAVAGAHRRWGRGHGGQARRLRRARKDKDWCSLPSRCGARSTCASSAARSTPRRRIWSGCRAGG